MKQGEVYFQDQPAGTITENDDGYLFEYDNGYLESDSPSISLTLPKSKPVHTSTILFPFFDGLIPEGWLLDIAIINWKINTRDRMELLLTCCGDTIGAVSVRRKL